MIARRLASLWVVLACALPCARARGEVLPCGIERPGGDVVAPGPRDPSPRPAASDPYAAAQLGIDWLMQDLCAWMQGPGLGTDCATGVSSSCMGCHVQAETVLGLARSAQRCYSLPWTTCSQPGDESPIEFATRFIAGCQRKACIVRPFNVNCTLTWGYLPTDPNTLDGYPAELGSIGHYPDCGSNAPPASVHPIIQSAHAGLNLVGYTRYISPAYSSNLLALSDWFATKQDPSGRWIPDRFEAPVDQGDVFCTGSAVMAMNASMPFASPAQVSVYDLAMQRALAWMRTATRAVTQDKAFALLTLVELGVPGTDPDRMAMLQDLLDDQLPDGGWAERAGLASNPYATGQALYALLEAGEPIDAPAVCSGIGWLVRRQNADGSWALGTPGLETDSGRNSYFTATIWPVLALGSLRPWGANVVVPNAALTSCADSETFVLEVTHAADTACGLFARPDTYLLSVSNDMGDGVTVVPSSITLQGGETRTVTVTWTRGAGPHPPGTVSTTTLVLDSEGAALAGCPVEVSSLLTVTTPADPVPGALGFGLRLSKDDGDVALSWMPLDEEIGGYEIVSVACDAREACPLSPTNGVLDGSVPRRALAPHERGAVLRAEAAPWGADLVFYKVRATSPCEGVPGPTCNFACSDPRACHAGCR